MPKAFRFRFDPVLRYRRIWEERRKRDFAVARMDVERQQGLLGKLRESERLERKELEGLRRGSLDLAAIRMHMTYMSAIGRQIAVGDLELIRLREVEEEKRQDYSRARRDVAVLEKYRDNQRDAHNKDLDRVEQKNLDEIAVRRAALSLQPGR